MCSFIQQTLSILIICRFHNCKFTPGITPKTKTCSSFSLICRHAEWQKFWVLQRAYSSWGQTRWPLVHTVNTCPFCGLSGSKFFAFLCLLLVISVLETVPRGGAKVLPSVPEHRKAVSCPQVCPIWVAQTCMLAWVGSEFNANESTVYIK